MAFGTLIYLSKRLTECFKDSNATHHEIMQTQKWLKVFIFAYVGMCSFNMFALIGTLSTIKSPFVMSITEILANFLLDLFTIGVTLYLNLQASSQHKL